ncbi:C1 family peptidase [Caulobacter sp. BP25]|uniref:C1 family peptidase n=1 Tax=Caulobacter sp. BP25 TaxID=2048900 RepID=UPI000C12C6F2|nr:C1 family peptidase [Caulobacter sp. BP25]PHY18804.1 hypothetical protein CSW59_10140 [Caulobacter sp. BP25]
MTFKPETAGSETPRILNCLPSVSQETDWTFAAAVSAGVADTALPESVNRREDWWTIGDQKNTGSCVGWATADGVLRYHFVKAGWIAKDTPLSPRFTWMASKELDEFTTAPTTFIEPEGTSLKAALDVSRKYGAALDGDLPFEGGRLFPGSAQVFYAKAARLKIASYINLGPSLLAWRRWLASNGPILVRLNVDATWANASAVPRLETYRAETALGGHAVALVGYTPDGFIVRNSWGESWGDNGFAFATNAYAAAAFTEAYGVILGGATQVSAGIAEPPPEAKDARPIGSWGGDEEDLRTLMLSVIKGSTGRTLASLSPMSEVFVDTVGLAQFLQTAEQQLDAPGALSSAPVATLERLRLGFFDELVDWVHHQIAPDRGSEPTSAEILAEMVPVTIVRDPATTIVMIKGVKLPLGVSALSLPAGVNTLRVGIRGKGGDAGTASVLRGGSAIVSQAVRIPAGLTEAYSAEESFNV